MTTLRDSDLHRVVQMLPEDVRVLIRQHGFALAGGSIRARVSGDAVSDFDLYAPASLTQEAISAAAIVFAEARGSRVFTGRNALTIATVGRTPVQIITRYRMGTPDDLIRRFDFTVAQAVVWYSDGHWLSLISDDFYADVAARRLVYVNPSAPYEVGASLLRARKFLRRGWQLPIPSLTDLVVRLVCEVEQVRVAVDPDVIRGVIRGQLLELDPLTVIDGVEVREDESED